MSKDLELPKLVMGQPTLRSYNMKALYESIQEGLGIIQHSAERETLTPPQLVDEFNTSLWDFIRRFGLIED